MNPLTQIDFYKAGHVFQYPPGTNLIYSNLTARSDKLAPVLNDFDHKVVFFGLQAYIKSFLLDNFNHRFFAMPKDYVLERYRRRMDKALGHGVITTAHIGELHDLRYLPLEIKALPEGTRVPIRTPMLTIKNTQPEFFWLVNYLETSLSASVWKPCTSATIAFEYRKLLTKYAQNTGVPVDFVNFQAHDFSFRGMSGMEDAALSGAAHLTSFWGTDTVAAIDLVEELYGANSDNEPVGFSVPATEHSVMCMGSKEGEIATFKRLVCDVYPKGIVSIVADTWDFWKVITEYALTLKDQIMAREGKVVFRPDSGDPVKIICGDSHFRDAINRITPEEKGAVECLWDIFGGTVNEAGYKVLDPHVGLIYGDSITIQRANAILQGLKDKGFASSNIVFGVGSFTYQHVTRDSFGFAVKSTYGEIGYVPQEIFKDPATDNGTKKSAVGLIRVNEDLTYSDHQTPEQAATGMLETVFKDGKLTKDQTLAEIRERLKNG